MKEYLDIYLIKLLTQQNISTTTAFSTAKIVKIQIQDSKIQIYLHEYIDYRH